MELISQPSQHLPRAGAAGDGIGEGDCQPMANIKVAVRIFAADVVRILRQAGAIAEVPVCAHVIERVSVGVTGHHAQAVIVSRVQSDLQSVVV